MKKPCATQRNSFLFGLDANAVLPCFLGQPQVLRYVGPHRFYRAAGRNANGESAAAYSGQWWADETVLLQIGSHLEVAQLWMSSDERLRAWPAQYRALTALSGDWNDMSEMFVMELPAGEELEGLVGPAREQAEFSAKDPLGRHDANRVLPGGAEQIFFKVKNPLWVRRVHLW